MEVKRFAVLNGKAEKETGKVADQVGAHIHIEGVRDWQIGTFVKVGGRHVAIIKEHRRAATVAELLFERQGQRYEPPGTAVRIGSGITPLSGRDWEDLQQSLHPKRIRVGSVRQRHLRDCPAYTAPLSNSRILIVGATGRGKTTAMQSLVCSQRNEIHRYLQTGNPLNKPIPGMVCFDLKDDLAGNHRDDDDKLRPSLLRCLAEDPRVIDVGDITCDLTDIPVSVILKCVGDLTTAQRRWAEKYANDDDDHSCIEALLYNESQWSEWFPEMCVNGKLTTSALDTLAALKSRLSGMIKPPLFINKHDKPANFDRVVDGLYRGECVIVRLRRFSEPQQTLLAILLLRTIMRRQFAALDRREACHPVVLAAPEFHKLTHVKPTVETLAREMRALNVGMLLDSQDLGDFPSIVSDSANRGIVFGIEGKSAKRVVERWPELKPHQTELHRLPPGKGFLTGGYFAVPVEFEQPPTVR